MAIAGKALFCAWPAHPSIKGKSRQSVAREIMGKPAVLPVELAVLPTELAALPAELAAPEEAPGRFLSAAVTLAVFFAKTGKYQALKITFLIP